VTLTRATPFYPNPIFCAAATAPGTIGAPFTKVPEQRNYPIKAVFEEQTTIATEDSYEGSYGNRLRERMRLGADCDRGIGGDRLQSGG
jgi:hypothetical protein